MQIFNDTAFDTILSRIDAVPQRAIKYEKQTKKLGYNSLQWFHVALWTHSITILLPAKHAACVHANIPSINNNVI